MAHTYTVDIKKAVVPGHHQLLYRVKITELDVQTGSEVVVTGVPIYGTILRYKATVTPVLATTVTPVVGVSAGWLADSQDEVSVTSAAAVHIDNEGAVNYYSPSGTLYFRSTPDVSGDAVATEILIYQGWNT